MKRQRADKDKTSGKTDQAGFDDPKRSETALKTLLARREIILSVVPDIIMEVNNDKIYTWANQAGVNFFGEDVIGKEAAYFFEGEQNTYQIVQPVFAGLEDVVYVESWQRCRDGQKRLLAWRCRTLKDEFGNIKGAVSGAIDITEQRRSEEKVRESEEKFKYVFDHSVIGKSITLPSGKVNSNKALCEMLGYSQEDLDQRRWQDITHPDDIEATQKALDSIISGEKDSARFVKRYIHKNGSVVWGDGSTSLRRDQEGKPLYFMSSVLDITERKRTQDALVASEEKFRKVFYTSPDAVSINRLSDGLYVAINTGFTRIMGYSEEEIVGRTSLELNIWADPCDRQRLVAGLRENGIVENLEACFRAKNGDLKYGLMAAALIEIDHRPHLLGIVRDITDRQRAEEALRDSEDKFKYIFDYSNVGKSITLPSGEIRVNKAFCEMVGFSPEEIQSKRWQDITHPDDIELTQKEMDSLFSNEKTETRFTKRFLKKDGSVIWVDLSSSLRLDASGKPLYLMTSIIDITERKKAEESLGESEKKYKTLFDEAPVGIAIATIEGTIIDVNKAQAEMIDYAVEELRGRNVNEYYVSPDKRKEMIDVFKKNGKIREHEMQLRRKDGLIVTELLNLDGVRIGEKNFLFVTGRDITEAKRTEGMLVKSEKRFRELSDLLPQIIFETDIKGNLTFANKYGIKSFGYSSEDFQSGVNIFALFAPEDREGVQRRMQEILSGSETDVREFQGMRKDGNKFPILVHATAILEDGVSIGVRGIAIDITERKRAEEQIRQSLKEKETLLREIYHRTKNNMNVIAAMLSLKARSSRNEVLVRTFGEIEEKIYAMALVHEKLYKSRDLSNIDLRDYVSDLAALLMRGRAISANDLTLVLDIDQIGVSIDVAIPCGMILTELFSNTFKHAFPDRRKGEIRIRIARTEEGEIELSYADNGIGVPQGFDFRSQTSLGLQTIFILVEHQLQGQAQFEGGRGVACRIRFNNTNIQTRLKL